MQLIIVSFATVLIKIISAEQCISSYQIQNTCLSTYGSLLTISQNVRSVSECSSICGNQPSCYSAVFDRVAASCTTNARILAKMSTDCNQTITYVQLKRSTCRAAVSENCLEIADCSTFNPICYDLACKCQHGYAFDPNTRNCTTWCPTYGSTFSVTHQYLIVGSIEQIYIKETLMNCAAHCLKSTGFTCRSFGFNYDNTRCHLSQTTLQENNHMGNPTTWANIYTRNCI